MSVEAFWDLSRDLRWSELVAGQVVELTPPGFRHGAIVMGLGQRLREHVTSNRLGVVTSDAGFILSKDPPTVRAPDVAVVFAERVPSPIPARFFPGPPDLAVEVLSPDDRPAEMAARIADFLRAGCRAVWVVDPEAETLTVHTEQGATRYAAHETLDGPPPLPAFRALIRDLLAIAP
ncbi:MAG: Uma2 family endonuclease [Armatimonadota bacterium]